MRIRLTLGLYRSLLAFYPKGFRAEFGEEMMAVFAQELRDSRTSSVQLLWRELRDWPGMVWRIHLAERSKTMVQTDFVQEQHPPVYQPVPAGTWREAWLAALGHLLYLWWGAGAVLWSALSGPLHMTMKTQNKISGSILGAILVIDFIVVLLCWRGGWPRWSFPYLGLVLAWLLLLGQSLIRNDGSLLFYVVPILPLIIFWLAVLGGQWKRLHSLYERLDREWTLLGLAYFSYVPFLFLIIFDETRYEASGILVISVVLALGVFIYMRCTSLWQRVVALPVVSIAAGVITIFFLQADYHALNPPIISSSFRIAGVITALAIAPLLIVGLLELGRYAFRRWLQAA
jgi:hypothetical protein